MWVASTVVDIRPSSAQCQPLHCEALPGGIQHVSLLDTIQTGSDCVSTQLVFAVCVRAACLACVLGTNSTRTLMRSEKRVSTSASCARRPKLSQVSTPPSDPVPGLRTRSCGTPCLAPVEMLRGWPLELDSPSRGWRAPRCRRDVFAGFEGGAPRHRWLPLPAASHGPRRNAATPWASRKVSLATSKMRGP